MLVNFFSPSYGCRQVCGGQPFKNGQIFLKNNLKKQAALKPNEPTQNLYLNDLKQWSPSADVCQLPPERQQPEIFYLAKKNLAFFPNSHQGFASLAFSASVHPSGQEPHYTANANLNLTVGGMTQICFKSLRTHTQGCWGC